MRRSIAAKIFVVSLGLFAFTLLIQWLFISRSFNQLYKNSINNAMHAELRKSVSGYRPKKAYDYYQPLNDYALETGSPILVFSEHYEITDLDLMNKMRLITVSMPQAGEVRVPIAYLYDIYGPNAPFIAQGHRMDAVLVQVGNSAFFEPLALRPADFSYKYRTNVEKYDHTAGILRISGNGIIVSTQNLRQEHDILTGRAEFIYGAVKDCLVLGLEIEPYLANLCAEPITFGEFDYRFLYETLTVEGIQHYFVTAQRVEITGFEQAYINQFFYIIYGILGLVLIAAALILSRWLSTPLKQLGQVAQQITALNFSQKARYESQDELGRLAADINKMSHSLEQALSSLQLSNAELEKASRLSRENESRMKLLLADLAHEFKTPIGLASGYVEVLQRGISPQRREEYFQIIKGELNQLTDLVDETIELTKLQAGYWQMNRGNHSIKDIVGTVYQKFEGRLCQEGYHVALDVADLLVNCDAFRIGQVISNFVSNALKYSNSDKRIVISALAKGGNAVITVGNSGALDAEEARLIWTRNYSADETIPARLPSQGIGLDIVKKLLDAHDSHFGVEQRDGMVYFYFTLPLILD